MSVVKRILLMLVFVLLGIWLISQTRPQISVQQKTLGLASEEKKQVKTLLSAPVELPPAPTHKTVDLEEECRQEATPSLNLSLERLTELIMDGREPLVTKCTENKTDLVGYVNWIQEICVRKNDLTDRQKDDCLTNIALYRASLIDNVTFGQKNFGALSETVVLNKAFALFNNPGWKDKAQFKELTSQMDELADDLQHRRPDWELPAKLKIAARMITSDGDGLAALATNAYQAHPGDPELLESKFFADVLNGGASHLLSSVQAYLRENPGDPIGHYWQAAAYRNLGDIGQSKESLKKAIELDPNNDRYKTTMTDVETDPKTANFNIQFKLPFADL